MAGGFLRYFWIVLAFLVSSWGCSRKADVDFSSDRPFLPSELGKALDTIGTPALEEWVEANPGDIEALNVLYGRYAMAGEHEKLICKACFPQGIGRGRRCAGCICGHLYGTVVQHAVPA